MTERLRKRIGLSEREGGFTLIELLVVLIIIAVLLAIAIPAYLGFKDRAQKRAAQSNVRIAIPSAEAYAQDNDGTANDADADATTQGYTGMDLAALQAIDDAVKIDSVTVYSDSDFCVERTEGSHVAHFQRSVDVVEIDAGGCP
jgi:prepilin-type N-terminal cleavage/methylation domain-containing protein